MIASSGKEVQKNSQTSFALGSMKNTDYPLFFFSQHITAYLLLAFAGVVIAAALFLRFLANRHLFSTLMCKDARLVFVSAAYCDSLASRQFTQDSTTGTDNWQQQLTLAKQWPDQSRQTLLVGEQVMHVEAVTQPQSSQQGLSGRESIGSDGMLFVLPARHVAGFWMKDMKFDLDFVWIDGGRVVDLTLAVPPPLPNTPLTDLPRYSPRQPVELVLELPAGDVERLGITINDEVALGQVE